MIHPSDQRETVGLCDGDSAESGPAPWINRRASDRATRAAHARHASGRRRLVDPATSERDYTADEVEFMTAMQEYKKRSGRLFPTWSEVLEVLLALGYEKATDADAVDDAHEPGDLPESSVSVALAGPA